MGKTSVKRKKSNKTTKSIKVEDVNGNKHILKATVIGIDQTGLKKNISQEIIDETLDELGIGDKMVSPPLSQTQLAEIQEISSELGQTIDAMAVGIEGFGARLIRKPMTVEFAKQKKQEINEERRWLQANLLDFPNPDGALVKLRKDSREDLEATGNSYWELVPSSGKKGRYSCYNKMDVGTIRIRKPDKNFVKMPVKYIDENFAIREKTFLKRFRRFVQIVGTKKRFFKEFRDPRIIDARDGSVAGPDLALKFRANEIFHFKLYTSRRTPYGLPRYTGNLIAVKGSRSADETNILTQQNNHVPSMAITVSGGALTDGSIERIQEFVDQQIKGDSNYSKFLILEGESSHDSLSGQGSFKIEIKPLTEAQHSDALWQQYDQNNADKVRRSFRLPPILTGSSKDYDRATAQVSERLAEKYVFNPEREEMDTHINALIMQQSLKYWTFKSNSPNVTNDEDIVKVITGGERSGGLTPRISRMLLEDILNRELPPIAEADKSTGWDPDVPFSFTLASLMQSAGMANQNGTMAPQGQTPKPPGQPGRPPVGQNKNINFDGFDPYVVLEGLVKLRDTLEETFEEDDAS